MKLFAMFIYTDKRVNFLSSYTLTKKMNYIEILKVFEVCKFYRKVYNQNCVGTGGCDTVRIFIVLLPF